MKHTFVFNNIITTGIRIFPYQIQLNIAFLWIYTIYNYVLLSVAFLKKLGLSLCVISGFLVSFEPDSSKRNLHVSSQFCIHVCTMGHFPVKYIRVNEKYPFIIKITFYMVSFSSKTKLQSLFRSLQTNSFFLILIIVFINYTQVVPSLYMSSSRSLFVKKNKTKKNRVCCQNLRFINYLNSKGVG